MSAKRTLSGIDVSALDAERHYRRAVITRTTEVDLGDRIIVLYRAEFLKGGSRWVTRDEFREVSR